MTETTQAQSAPTPRRRWLAPLLIVSLAINLLIVGAVAGWAWRSGPSGHDRHGGAERIVRLLPEAKRDQARAIIARYRRDEDRQRAQIEAARSAVLAALTAEPFERPALEQALTTLSSAEALRRRNPAVLGEIAQALNAEERRELADRFRRIMERGRR